MRTSQKFTQLNTPCTKNVHFSLPLSSHLVAFQINK